MAYPRKKQGKEKLQYYQIKSTHDIQLSLQIIATSETPSRFRWHRIYIVKSSKSTTHTANTRKARLKSQWTIWTENTRTKDISVFLRFLFFIHELPVDHPQGDVDHEEEQELPADEFVQGPLVSCIVTQSVVLIILLYRWPCVSRKCIPPTHQKIL